METQTTRSADNQPETNRGGRIALALFVLLPLSVIAILWIFAFVIQGRGSARVCVTAVTAQFQLRLQVEPRVIGGVSFEAHRLEVSQDGGEGWIVMYDEINPGPFMGIDCETNILSFAPESALFWDERNIFITTARGDTWQRWQVCSPPRPAFGCVGTEVIRSVEFAQPDTGRVVVYAPEGSYRLQTNDAGQTWSYEAHP